MKHLYQNFSTKIFQGFYESNLWNSDTLYNMEYDEEMPDGYHFDIHDWKMFTNEVAEKAVKILWNQLSEDVIKGFKYNCYNSPRFYNFETDKLMIDVDFDENELVIFCFSTFKKEFDEYLSETFTSRDGFISFIPNTLKSFKDWNDERRYDVMIEFYLLQTIDFDDYEDELYESLFNIRYEHLCLEKDGEYFTYHYGKNDEIIVGEKID